MRVLSAAVVLAALLVSQSSSFAASDQTVAAAANIRPNVNFLDRSSRYAIDHSNNERVRAFARSEAIEQTATANAVLAWTQVATPDGAALAIGRSEATSSGVGDVTTPLTAVLDPSNVQSGRSAAVDKSAEEQRHILLPSGEENALKLMATQRGRKFDETYKAFQYDVLLQLSTLYTEYVQNGDDEALRSLAVRELPKINRRLSQLRDL